MQHEEFNLQMSDGFTAYGQGWHPEGPAKAAVCLIHGLGEHTGRYAYVAEKFTEHHFAILGCDQRGHGKSGGPRGHFPNYEQVMKDVKSTLEFLKEKYPTQPIFLYGHSMGGSIVLNYGLRMKPQVNGIIATSPGLKTGNELSSALLALGKILYTIAPSMGLNNGLDVNNLSHDPAVVAAYKADPLVHPKISARFALDFLNSGQWASEHAAEFPVPLLIQIGSEDRLVSVETARAFAQAAPDCTYREWPGLFHETHNEPQKDEVLQVTLDWISEHCG